MPWASSRARAVALIRSGLAGGHAGRTASAGHGTRSVPPPAGGRAQLEAAAVETYLRSAAGSTVMNMLTVVTGVPSVV